MVSGYIGGFISVECKPWGLGIFRGDLGRVLGVGVASSLEVLGGCSSIFFALLRACSGAYGSIIVRLLGGSTGEIYW